MSNVLRNKWYNDNDKTLYYYSEANEIDMNANAMNMFSNL